MEEYVPPLQSAQIPSAGSPLNRALMSSCLGFSGLIETTGYLYSIKLCSDRAAAPGLNAYCT